MKIRYLSVLLSAALLLAGCAENGNSALQPYMIKAGNKAVDLLEPRSELEKQLGSKFNAEDSFEVGKSVIVCGTYYGDFNGFDYSDFHPVFDQENSNRKKFALYNGITVNTGKEQVETLLGDCIKFEGESTDYIECFVNGEEIDYSLVDTSDFSDVENEYSRYSQAARAYCAEQLNESESGNYVVICVSCYSEGDNDISVSVFKK